MAGRRGRGVGKRAQSALWHIQTSCAGSPGVYGVMVRLWVSGIPAGTTCEQLAQRFSAFGTVGGCEVVPPKMYRSLPGDAGFERGFGYVELEPTDDAALRKCMAGGWAFRGRLGVAPQLAPWSQAGPTTSAPAAWTAATALAPPNSASSARVLQHTTAPSGEATCSSARSRARATSSGWSRSGLLGQAPSRWVRGRGR